MDTGRGAALLSVLLALTLTSALVVGGSYVARQSATASGIHRRGAELDAWAEEALARAVAGWDSTSRHGQPIGHTEQLGLTLRSGIQVRSTATRVGARTWWLVAEVTSLAKPLLHRHLGLIVLADSAGARPVAQRAWLDLP